MNTKHPAPRCPEPDCCYYGQASASSCACIDDDNEPAMCSDCSGSGEGQFDGSTCRACSGMGEINNQREIA